MENKKQRFSNNLLRWYDKNYFDFPWRKSTNPYVIFISEILLRKTSRKQVEQIFSSFFTKYPDFRRLHAAKVEELESDVKSLGLQTKRSRSLKVITKTILDEYNGVIPTDRDELLKLPNVGRYTANATLCFIYNLDYPIVDTNVIRIVDRVFGYKSSNMRPRDDPELWKIVSTIIPKGKARKFNYALLDFAASVCSAKQPKCDRCPIIDICLYYQKTDFNFN